jgi:hypothetical protein
VSLLATLALLTIGALALGIQIHRRLPADRRVELGRRMRAGVVAGCAGLAAYDVSRWLLVNLGHMQFKPFDVFYTFGVAMFGQAILGAHQPPWVLTAAGAAFHLLNGLGFAVAYAVWAGRRGPLAGVAFAMGLQVLMVAVYPTWLRIQLLDEFLQVSITGHLAYGLVVGATCRYLLTRGWRPGNAAASG